MLFRPLFLFYYCHSLLLAFHNVLQPNKRHFGNGDLWHRNENRCSVLLYQEPELARPLRALSDGLT